MQENSVLLLKAPSYEKTVIDNVINQIEDYFEINTGLFKEKKIGVKPNLLTSAMPESGIITHPEIIRSVIRMIKRNGGTAVFVESPAFHPLERVLKKTGIGEILDKENVYIADTKKTAAIYNSRGIKFKSFQVARELIECDIIINLPKMKTHGLTYFTGAVKNLFGTIHGLEKSKWHFRANNPYEFTSFLLDFYGAYLELGKRMIHIMDGVIGLEGEGPGSGGRAKQANAIIAGDNALLVDTVAVAVAGLQIEKALTCIEGVKRDYGTADISKVPVHGESPDSFKNHFIEPENKSVVVRWPFSSPSIKNLLIERPVPQSNKCTLCYQCKTICPAGAITASVNGKVPSYDYRKCLRCYCCMEICPENAIVLSRGLLGKIF